MFEIFYLYLSLIIFLASCLGFAVIFKKICNIENHCDLGTDGFYGIFLLVFILYTLNLFLPINTNVASAIHLIGLIFFIYNYKSSFKYFENEKILKLLLILLPIFALIIFKSHDDFPYYHLPFSTTISNSNLIFGLGMVNHGFKTPSSIFYLYASTNLFYFSNKIIHIVPMSIMIFFNFFLIDKIFSKKNEFVSTMAVLAFALTNIIFYRIAEHGTDRSGQLIQIIIALIFLDIVLKNKIKKIDLLNIFLLCAISSTLKNYFIVNYIFILFLFFIFKEKIFTLFKFNLKIFIFLSSIIIIHFFILNFASTGCFLYPIKITCITSLDYSIKNEEIKLLSVWYELWAKAGAGPNYTVNDQISYISNFNWVNNWIQKYFFNKVSDFLLGALFIVTVSFFFLTKVSIKKNSKLNFPFLIIILILFLEWFIKHPTLRYGGYSIIIILVSYISTVLFNRNDRFFSGKTRIYFLLIVVSIFCLRNVIRIDKEINQYNFKILSNPYPYIKKTQFEKNGFLNIVEGYCWDVKPICSRSNEFIVQKFLIFKKIVRK